LAVGAEAVRVSAMGAETGKVSVVGARGNGLGR
jgi:hypothetical protein